LEHPHGYVKEGKLFRNSFLEFPDKQIALAEDGVEIDFSPFEKAFADLSIKVDELEKLIVEAQNKGSFLIKLQYMKSTMPEHDGLGDYSALYTKLQQLEEYLEGIITSNRARNLEIKRALLAEAEGLQHSIDWMGTSEAMKELRLKWIKTGGVEAEFTDELESKFKKSMDVFFQRKSEFFEDKRKMTSLTIGKYHEIIEEAKALNMARPENGHEESLKLIEKWKQQPSIPATDRQSLWADFSKLLSPFMRKKNATRSNEKSGAKSFAKGDPKEKKAINDALKTLINELPDNAEKQLEELILKARNSGRISGPEGRDLQKEYLLSVDILREKLFLNRLVQSKTRGYANLSENEQKKIQLSFIKELLSRDQKDFDVFNENLEKVNTISKSSDQMMTRKLESFKRKIEAKKWLLNELKNSNQS
jgi:hypothetical protein